VSAEQLTPDRWFWQVLKANRLWRERIAALLTVSILVLALISLLLSSSNNADPSQAQDSDRTAARQLNDDLLVQPKPDVADSSYQLIVELQRTVENTREQLRELENERNQALEESNSLRQRIANMTPAPESSVEETKEPPNQSPLLMWVSDSPVYEWEFDPESRRLFASQPAAAEVVEVDIANRSIVHRFAVGGEPADMVIKRRQLIVNCKATESLAAIDLDNNQVIPGISYGSRSVIDLFCSASDSHFVYMVCQDISGSTILRFDLNSRAIEQMELMLPQHGRLDTVMHRMSRSGDRIVGLDRSGQIHMYRLLSESRLSLVEFDNSYVNNRNSAAMSINGDLADTLWAVGGDIYSIDFRHRLLTTEKRMIAINPKYDVAAAIATDGSLAFTSISGARPLGKPIVVSLALESSNSNANSKALLQFDAKGEYLVAGLGDRAYAAPLLVLGLGELEERKGRDLTVEKTESTGSSADGVVAARVAASDIVYSRLTGKMYVSLAEPWQRILVFDPRNGRWTDEFSLPSTATDLTALSDGAVVNALLTYGTSTHLGLISHVNDRTTVLPIDLKGRRFGRVTKPFSPEVLSPGARALLSDGGRNACVMSVAPSRLLIWFDGGKMGAYRRRETSVLRVGGTVPDGYPSKVQVHSLNTVYALWSNNHIVKIDLSKPGRAIFTTVREQIQDFDIGSDLMCLSNGETIDLASSAVMVRVPQGERVAIDEDAKFAHVFRGLNWDTYQLESGAQIHSATLPHALNGDIPIETGDGTVVFGWPGQLMFTGRINVDTATPSVP
jgi:hypothetical protein